MHRFCLAVLLILAACSTPPPATVAPSPTVDLAGTITIDYPKSGSAIYTETLLLGGTAADVPAFSLTVTGPDETVIATAVAIPVEGRWAVDLLHGYTGAPIEATITASTLSGSYDAETIALAGIDWLPDTPQSRIHRPSIDDTVGGESIPVSGFATGRSVSLTLHGDQEQMLDTVTIDLHNLHEINLMAWSGEIMTAGYIGPAELRAATDDGTLFDTVRLMITRAAG